MALTIPVLCVLSTQIELVPRITTSSKTGLEAGLFDLPALSALRTVDEHFDPGMDDAERDVLYAGWKRAVGAVMAWANETPGRVQCRCFLCLPAVDSYNAFNIPAYTVTVITDTTHLLSNNNRVRAITCVWQPTPPPLRLRKHSCLSFAQPDTSPFIEVLKYFGML